MGGSIAISGGFFMRCVFFYHSLVSDWNHGNAHFLRGIVSELLSRGHEVKVYEPESGWSIRNLKEHHGTGPILEFHRRYPHLRSIPYRTNDLDVTRILEGADLVLVHEWNDPELVRRIGEIRKHDSSFRLLFHDTHHRSVTRPDVMATYDLSGYDGVLAFGEVIRERYLDRGWARQAWVWHEAADTRVFRPTANGERDGDLVWIGNWGDEERTEEYEEFLVGPVRSLGLISAAYGVRYPASAINLLAQAGISYDGWLANYNVPQILARYRVTLHIPRRPYVTRLPGIPTIRPFEALACGIPLVCAPWEDTEHLFNPGKDYLVARNGEEMKKHIRCILHEPETARALVEHGLRTIWSRHTCVHRVNELMEVSREIGVCPERVNEMENSVSSAG